MGDCSQYYFLHMPYHPHHQKEIRLPKAVFPKFDGSNPKVWREKCEKYFNMYHIPMHLWAQFATIHFKGSAKLWLHTYEAQHSDDDISWAELCIAIESKFGKDLYHNAMHDLLLIKQTSDVQEYYDRFQTAMHKVLVHNKSYDDVFFVSKFLQGLNPDIRAAIALHKPRTVDATLSLALMQVSILDSHPKPIFRRNGRDFPWNQGRPPQNPQPGIMGPQPVDDIKPRWDAKLAALRTQRKAQGLCMTCGEKWGKNHKCPDKIDLHVLEELMDALQPDPTKDDSSYASTEEEDEIFSLSHCAFEGNQGKKTIKLSGLVNHQEILILIDFGSSCTFLSEQAATTLQCAVSPAPPVSVTVANGQKLTSSLQVQQFTWWTQGHTFSHTTRVLPISCFDLVLGMDWLESHSPMWIHWKRKLLRFSYQGARISLKGLKDITSSCPKLKLRKLRGLVCKGGIAQVIQLCPLSAEQQTEVIPHAVQQLITVNEQLFQEPKGLPPPRTFDHQIPLIPGVKPVNVKPYRYSPTQ
jgi:hypothetical protein